MFKLLYVYLDTEFQPNLSIKRGFKFKLKYIDTTAKQVNHSNSF